MAMFSVELCQRKVKLWLAAEEAVATGQEYQIGTRKLTRADLKAVREELEYGERGKRQRGHGGGPCPRRKCH